MSIKNTVKKLAWPIVLCVVLSAWAISFDKAGSGGGAKLPQGDLEDRVSDLEYTVSELQDTISDLENMVSDLESTMSDLSDRVDELESDR
jgi:hypothetical protein